MKDKANNNYIPLQEAIKLCNYSQEYLSLRARQGKLKAVKIGRNWVTTKEWLKEYLGKVEEHDSDDKNKKISLQEAAGFCNYSQEYLSLRARQGKLKAVKIGRNWATTPKWLKDYLGGIEEYHDLVSGRKVEKPHLAKPEPPENLPVGEFAIKPPVKLSFIEKLADNLVDLRPAFAAALVLVLLLGSGVLGKESLIKSYNNISPYTRPIKNAISNRVQIVGEAKDFVIEDAVQGLVEVPAMSPME